MYPTIRFLSIAMDTRSTYYQYKPYDFSFIKWATNRVPLLPLPTHFIPFTHSGPHYRLSDRCAASKPSDLFRVLVHRMLCVPFPVAWQYDKYISLPNVIITLQANEAALNVLAQESAPDCETI